MKNNEEIEKIAIDIGAKMIENGAEINRCEDTIKRILKSRNLAKTEVFCISSLLIIHTERTTQIKRISHSDLNLFEIDKLNSNSRAICNFTELKNCKNRYSPFSKTVLTFLSTSSFCLFFGGSVYDAIFAGIIGLIMNIFKLNINGIFAKTLCLSVIGGALSLIPCLFFDRLSIDKIMIGTIMLLIPGLTIGNAIRDIMSADIISGLIELTEAIFVAVAIALGYSISLWVYRYV